MCCQLREGVVFEPNQAENNSKPQWCGWSCRLKLTTKVLLIVCTAFAAFFCVAGPLLFIRTEAGYLEFERSDAEAEVNRVLRRVQVSSEELDSSNRKFAISSSVFDTLNSGNSEKLKQIVAGVPLQRLDIEGVFLYDSAGRYQAGALVTNDPIRDRNKLPEMAGNLSRLALKWYLNSPRGASGILILPTGPVCVSVRPVAPADKNIPPAGWSVSFREIQASEFSIIGQKTVRQRLFEINPNAVNSSKVSSDSVKVVRRVEGVSPEQQISFTVEGDRIFNRSKQESFAALLGALVVIAFVMIGLLYFMLRKAILGRLTTTVDHLNEIREGKRTQIEISGHDELSKAADEVNRLIRELIENKTVLTSREEELQSINNRLEDIVEHRTKQLEKTNKMMENALEGIALFDNRGRFLQANPSFCDILGATQSELVGLNWKRFVSEEYHHDVKQSIRFVGGGGRAEVETQGTRMDGLPFHQHLVIIPSYTDGGTLAGFYVCLRDISDKKLLEEKLFKQAFFDELTGLCNRRYFTNEIENLLRLGVSDQAAVLFIDLDNFKYVNDSLGHNEGDRLLKVVASRFRDSVSEGDLVARMAGDEFTILIQSEHTEEAAVAVANRILKCLAEPIRLETQEVLVSCSIGIAHAANADTPQDILRHADTAMYKAKASGKSSFAVFKPEMVLASVERLEIEMGLRRAIEEEQFRAQYQPIISLHDNKVVGVEALIRWEHPVQGQIQPGKFIGIAEETGLIRPIGWWILEETCRQVKHWNDTLAKGREIFASVNLSARQILHDDVERQVSRILQITHLSPEHLKLEITETVLMENLDLALEKLGAIRKLGVSLALDDFGTGYSSLSYLSRMPVNVLKIDRDFVTQLGRNEQSTVVVKSVAALSRTLNIVVVAEGVETAKQAAQLREIGVEYGQGYYFSRPLTADVFENNFFNVKRDAA